MTLNCIHIFIVTGRFLYWCVVRPASQRFFVHSCIFLRIFIISYLATFLGTNSLSVLMCRKAVSQSINQSINHWLPIQKRIYFKLATLVHRSLHYAGPQYLSSLLLPYTPSCQLCSVSLILVSTLLLSLVVFNMLILLFAVHSLIISDLSTLTRSSNPI